MDTPEQQYQDALARLRARITSSPRRSWTAAQARRLIDNLEGPRSTFTIAERLRAVNDALAAYQRGLDFTDAIQFHPGDRPAHE